MPKANYEAPQEAVQSFEAPRPPVNYERLHGAALEEINRLNEELDQYRGEAKVVSLVSGPLGVIALDDKGHMYEWVNSKGPAGPWGVIKEWRQLPGPGK